MLRFELNFSATIGRQMEIFLVSASYIHKSNTRFIIDINENYC